MNELMWVDDIGAGTIELNTSAQIQSGKFKCALHPQPFGSRADALPLDDHL